MSHPAFQIPGEMPVRLPTYHLGSDDLLKELPGVSVDIEVQRYGVPISIRQWRELRRWRVNFNSVTEAQVGVLRPFWAARTFRFLPGGDPNIYVSIRWVDKGFEPDYIKPGYYSLSFVIEEV